MLTRRVSRPVTEWGAPVTDRASRSVAVFLGCQAQRCAYLVAMRRFANFLRAPTTAGRRAAALGLIFVCSGASFVRAQAPPHRPSEEATFGVRASYELGLLAVLDHDIQLSTDGTAIDYPSDVGQDNLFAVSRFTAEVDIVRRHIITFVYQPLQLDSRTTLSRDLRIDGLDYPAGTTIVARYGFPYFRLGWAYDLLPRADQELAIGVGGQLRNATVEFASLDGTRFRSRRDVGPVPLLRARGRFPLARDVFFAFEVDGFYAPISVLNGSDNEVTGAIADVSVRLGAHIAPHFEAFIDLRYIGGGAVGSGDPTPTSDGFQRNWLHFLAVSLGGTFDSRDRASAGDAEARTP